MLGDTILVMMIGKQRCGESGYRGVYGDGYPSSWLQGAAGCRDSAVYPGVFRVRVRVCGPMCLVCTERAAYYFTGDRGE